MLIKKYECKVFTSRYKSDFREEVSPPLSDLYILKEQGWLNYSVEAGENLKDLTIPLIHSKKVYKTYVEYQLNSLNFFFTDVSLDGVFYKYRIKFNDPSLTLDKLKFYLKDYTIVRIDNQFYTNTLGFYHTENLTIFTENVLNPDTFEVVYKSKHISVKTPVGCEAIPNQSILSPQMLNEYSVYIPSFYLQVENEFVRCIDSNIIKRELEIKGKQHPSYRIISSSNNSSQALNLTFEHDVITLQHSSHVFPVPSSDITYSIDWDGSVREGEGFLNFTIYKNIELEKVKIIPNNYKYLNSYVNIEGYLRNRVLSSVEVDPGVNSFFDSYVGISKTFNSYVYLEFVKDFKKIKMTPRGIEEEPDLSFLEMFYPGEYSCNRVPCLFEDIDSKTNVIVDGVNYVY